MKRFIILQAMRDELIVGKDRLQAKQFKNYLLVTPAQLEVAEKWAERAGKGELTQVSKSIILLCVRGTKVGTANPGHQYRPTPSQRLLLSDLLLVDRLIRRSDGLWWVVGSRSVFQKNTVRALEDMGVLARAGTYEEEWRDDRILTDVGKEYCQKYGIQ